MLPLVAAAIVALAPLPVHASVIDTNPDDAEVLTAPVDAFTVTVNEEILDVGGVDTANAITITDASGAFYGDGCAVVDGETLSAAATLGAPGTYTMAYSLVSSDGHTIGDELTFEWAPEGDVEVATGAAAAPVCGEEAQPSATPEPSATDDEGTSSSTAPSASSDEAAGATDGDDEGGGIDPLVILGIVGVVVVAGIVIGVVRTSLRKR